jgi:hypothetical protein
VGFTPAGCLLQYTHFLGGQEGRSRVEYNGYRFQQSTGGGRGDRQGFRQQGELGVCGADEPVDGWFSYVCSSYGEPFFCHNRDFWLSQGMPVTEIR